ncbi:MAG: acyl carrier protein [Bacilli bacterium]
MKEEMIFERLEKVFREVFDDETIKLTKETPSSDVEGWDSLSHLLLIQSVEDEFSFSFEMKDIVSMENVGAMIDIIKEHI